MMILIIDSPLWEVGVICDAPKDQTNSNIMDARKAPRCLIAVPGAGGPTARTALCSASWASPESGTTVLPNITCCPGWPARAEHATGRRENPSCEHAQPNFEEYRYFAGTSTADPQPLIAGGHAVRSREYPQRMFDPCPSGNGEGDHVLLRPGRGAVQQSI
jgi:hypothetical protein